MRCVRALQIQRLEGSRLWGLQVDEPSLIVREVVGCCRCASVSVGGRRENGRGAAHRRVLDRTTTVHSEEYETQNQREGEARLGMCFRRRLSLCSLPVPETGGGASGRFLYRDAAEISYRHEVSLLSIYSQ